MICKTGGILGAILVCRGIAEVSKPRATGPLNGAPGTLDTTGRDEALNSPGSNGLLHIDIDIDKDWIVVSRISLRRVVRV